MQTQPLISIIVPVYNAEKYIQRCIDSILAQTYHNFELLLIDDGATDRSGAICDDYASKESRIKVFHKENGGVSSARNVGLDSAMGEWIAFADSDDFVKDSWLSDYVSEIGRDLNFGLIYQGIITLENGVEGVGKPIENRVFSENEIVDAYIYLDRDIDIFGWTCAKIYRADILRQNKLRFDPSISFCEDLEFTFRFMQSVENISVVNKLNYVYTFDNDITLSRRSHSYETLDNLVNMINNQLIILSRRTDRVYDRLFDIITHYRFRALKSLYKPSLDKTTKERCVIIDHYSTHYLDDLKRLDVYDGTEKFIVKILGLKCAKLIDLIYKFIFFAKSRLDKLV